MFCTNCGAKLADGVSFCEFCGAKVEYPQKPAEVPQESVAVNDTADSNTENAAPVNPVPVNTTVYEAESRTENQPDDEVLPPVLPVGSFNYQEPGQQQYASQESYDGNTAADGNFIDRVKASIMDFLNRYVDFKGRSNRFQYWSVFLVNFLITAVLSPISQKSSIASVIVGLYTLAVLIPGIAITFRRLHDVGKSGAYIFINLIPIVGQILFIIALAGSSVADNEYGSSPKG